MKEVTKETFQFYVYTFSKINIYILFFYSKHPYILCRRVFYKHKNL